MENPNPVIYEVKSGEWQPARQFSADETPTVEEVFNLIRGINDPEHPLSLEELNVVQLEHIQVSDGAVEVLFTPTIPHCSMATLIGLCIRIQLQRCLPKRLLTTVRIREGTHVSEEAINKQLMDKERVAAAIENDHLISVVNQCILGPKRAGIAL